jgi:hypothetical protein
MKTVFVLLGVCIFLSSPVFAATLCPDGQYHADGVCKLCPDGSYTTAPRCALAPDGTYAPDYGRGTRLAPDGRYIPTLAQWFYVQTEITTLAGVVGCCQTVGTLACNKKLASHL